MAKGHDHGDGDLEDWGGHGGSQNWWGGGFNLDLSGLLATIVEQLTANNGALLTAIQAQHTPISTTTGA